MEVPLTEPCPVCGAEMEPRGRTRRGRAIYTCPECGYEMETEPERDLDVGEAEEDEQDVDEDDLD